MFSPVRQAGGQAGSFSHQASQAQHTAQHGCPTCAAFV
jgi:hypothetical protein